MAIADRNLQAGTQLTATYKKQTFTADVIEQDGALRFRLADGRIFASPSSAGKAVLGGKSCNGWAFWSLATPQESATPAEAETPTQAEPPAEPQPTSAREALPAPKPEPKGKRGKPTVKIAFVETAPDTFLPTRAEAEEATPSAE